jgi:cytochrome c-type biogenesis protein CcmF
MIGSSYINILFVSAVIAAIFYFISYFKKPALIKYGRYFFYFMSFGLIFVSGHFLYLIITHDFQYTYVWNYSSTNLSIYYLISSFYAGQEGSFLLWTLFFGLIGFFLIPYCRKEGYESLAMGFYSLIIVFLLTILIFKSPFDYVWESFPDVSEGFMPREGRGLNPILENYWITIHPPILFIGYSLMSIPYVLAVSALIKRDYTDWIKLAIPWTLAGSGILGLGIGLGAFWSYETLGWGGFWGWDPVENSSLMPWLLSIALVHTMYVQKNTGGLIKTNFLLAILSYVFVLYSTFLTRSGILGDISVHSFVEPGGLVYSLLLGFILLFLITGFILLILRIRDINQVKNSSNFISKESFLSLGVILLIISTIIIFIGTSFPIFLELTGQTKTSVEVSFYDKWNLPVATVFTFLCGFSIFLNWKTSNLAEKKLDALIPLLAAIISVIILFYSGIDQLKHLILAFGSLYCLYVNILYLLKKIKNKPKMTGAYFSHAGVGLFFLGVIFSGGYSLNETMMITKGQTGEEFGYKFTYLGSDRIEQEKKDREKYKCNIKIEKDGNFSLASPVVYWSDFNDRQAPFMEPGIESYCTKDIYISPKSLIYQNNIPSIIIGKDETKKLPHDSSYSITFLGFDMNHGTVSDSKNNFIFGSIVKFTKNGDIFQDTMFINVDMNSGETKPLWKKLKGSNLEIGFTNFSANTKNMEKSQAQFSISKPDEEMKEPTEVFTFDISMKPFINFVWIGSLTVFAGFFIAAFKHRNKKR